MTATPVSIPPAAGFIAPAIGPRRLVGGPLLLLFVASVGVDASLYLLLAVVPALAGAGSGTGDAGLATASLMLASVVGELGAMRLSAWLGRRAAFVLGAILLGAPSLVLLASTEPGVILAVSAARGVGFGISVVIGGAFVASLAPAGRRGETLGLYGIVVGAPAIAALPLGAWVAGVAGTGFVVVAGAVAALAAVPAIVALPDERPSDGAPRGLSLGAAMRRPGILRPALVFSAPTVAAGIVVTFLPLIPTGEATAVVAPALLLQALTATVARWWAGRFSDHHDARRLFMPGVLATAAGIVMLAWTGQPVAVLAGAAGFGVGFGLLQSATLAVMLARVDPDGYATVSTVWNLVYDAGYGLGPAGFGILAGAGGLGMAFTFTAAAILVALIPAWRDANPERRQDAELG